MRRRPFMNVFMAIAGLLLILGSGNANAHEEAQKEARVAAVVGELIGFNDTEGTITIVEQGSRKNLTFLVTEDTVVSICRLEVCSLGKGMGAFGVLEPYEDLGIDQKGSTVSIVSLRDKKEAISIDVHLKRVHMEFSPSDFISPF